MSKRHQIETCIPPVGVLLRDYPAGRCSKPPSRRAGRGGQVRKLMGWVWAALLRLLEWSGLRKKTRSRILIAQPTHARRLLSGRGMRVQCTLHLELALLVDALGILSELNSNAVFRGQSADAPGMRPRVFFSASRGYISPFPQLQAAWDKKRRVAVFYGVGCGASFRAWALTVDPDYLYGELDRHANDLVVVVASIQRLDYGLGKFLENEKKRIWSP
jgi:hypothetical protein